MVDLKGLSMNTRNDLAGMANEAGVTSNAMLEHLVRTMKQLESLTDESGVVHVVSQEEDKVVPVKVRMSQ